MRTAWHVISATFRGFLKDDGLRLAAALSFYTVLSLAPMLLLALIAADYFVGQEGVNDALVGFATRLGGDAIGQLVAEVLGTSGSHVGDYSASSVTEKLRKGSVSGIASLSAGFAVVVFAATTVFANLQTSLNMMWGVDAKPGKTIAGWFRRRGRSLLTMIAFGMLLPVTLILSTVVTWLTNQLGPGAWALQAASYSVTLLIFVLFFAMVYKLLPDVRLEWGDVWLGAVVTAVLFAIGREAIGLYLARSGAASLYGAAGSLFVVLLWVYYSSVIFFVGAEFVQAFATVRGRQLRPGKFAVRVERRIIEHK